MHRLAWILKRGPIPKGKEVCHECDNKPCFNVKHLFTGTHLENMRDAVSKNLIASRKGEAHGCSKLTANKVRSIRRIWRKSPHNQKAIGKRFGVRASTIGMIVTRKTWRHI